MRFSSEERVSFPPPPPLFSNMNYSLLCCIQHIILFGKVKYTFLFIIMQDLCLFVISSSFFEGGGGRVVVTKGFRYRYVSFLQWRNATFNGCKNIDIKFEYDQAQSSVETHQQTYSPAETAGRRDILSQDLGCLFIMYFSFFSFLIARWGANRSRHLPMSSPLIYLNSL